MSVNREISTVEVRHRLIATTPRAFWLTSCTMASACTAVRAGIHRPYTRGCSLCVRRVWRQRRRLSGKVRAGRSPRSGICRTGARGKVTNRHRSVRCWRKAYRTCMKGVRRGECMLVNVSTRKSPLGRSQGQCCSRPSPEWGTLVSLPRRLRSARPRVLIH